MNRRHQETMSAPPARPPGETVVAPLWDFTDLIPTERRTSLLEARSFDDVVREVASACTIIDYEAETFSGQRLCGCMRASFLLLVGSFTYDRFFNSPVGYRAQYCLSRGIGERGNRQMVNIPKPSLIAFAQPRSTPTFGPERVASSLDALDAKIWIDEREPASNPPQELQVQINYLPWVERAKRADALQEEEFIGALRGVFAPFGTRLKVKGGWLDVEWC